jgi:hypothetical protein
MVSLKGMGGSCSLTEVCRLVTSMKELMRMRRISWTDWLWNIWISISMVISFMP